MIANGNGIGAAFIGAALGGTAIALTGGSFANVAVTAAFVVLFNDMMHKAQVTKWKNIEALRYPFHQLHPRKFSYPVSDCLYFQILRE